MISSLDQPAGEAWPWAGMGITYPRSAFVAEEFSPNFCFINHNIGSRYASKTTKGSKDSDDSLESNKSLNHKNGHLSRGLGPGNLSHKIAKTCHHYDVTHRENFLSKLEDMQNP